MLDFETFVLLFAGMKLSLLLAIQQILARDGVVFVAKAWLCLVGLEVACIFIFFADPDLLLLLILNSSVFVIYTFFYAGFYKSLSARVVNDLYQSGPMPLKEIYQTYGKSALSSRIEMLTKSGVVIFGSDGFTLSESASRILKAYTLAKRIYNIRVSG